MVGDLTVNAPNATVNNAATISGTTTIGDVADHTFNNTGTLNKVKITDPNGGSFNNKGTIKGEVTIEPSSEAKAPVVLKGNITSQVKVTGDNKPQVKVEGTVKSIEVEASSTKLEIVDDAKITGPIIINKPVTIITKKSVPAKVKKDVKVTIKDDENSEGKEVIGKGKDQEIELEPKGDVSDPVDKSELESKIAEVMKLNKEDYTEKTWSILEVALDMPEATQEEVDAKVKAIDEAINGLVKVSYSFEANLDRAEFNIGEDITISGIVLKDESGLANVHIAITVVTEDGNQLVTMNEVTTDENGEFSHTFKVPEGTEAGTYKLKVQANQPVNKEVELDLVMVEEPKPEVKVTFNHTEYTVEVGGYIPEEGDLIVTTTGLEDDEIESVTIKSSDESIVEVTQRPVYVEGGFPKSKTRAYGKAIAPGQASIIATVTAKDGKEYTAECKVTVKAKEQKTEVELYYYDGYGFIGFTIKPITKLPDRACYFKVIIGDKESGTAQVTSSDGVMFNGITIEEVQQAGEVTVQFFYDNKGEEKVVEVQVTPIPYE